MQQKAPQELVNGQSHQLLLIAMGRVAPAEGDVAVFERNESVVGNGDAVGVGAEITQGMFGASERSLGVDDPFVTEQSSQPCCEGTRFRQMQHAAVELKCAGTKCGL